MIAIIDYGMGNLRSVSNAINLLGEDTIITCDPEIIKQADAIIIPGVGAFSDGISNLHKYDLVKTLNEEVLIKKKPVLGICLGMQLFAKKSEEHGIHQGLGWIEGTIKKIVPKLSEFKIPHVGWNDIKIIKKEPLFSSFDEEPTLYFVHSFHFTPENGSAKIISAQTSHGTLITSAIQKENIFGTQFHPEKSQNAGLKILENFLKFVKEHKNG